ncbi:hypothetical protein [Xanthomonas oryzae]|uniref:Secreted protein n=1 Tax=Xanthomonas oryzae pv. oryzae TaxID=64187 RepID=A0A854CM90_XANOO|nr:hypothetical protein [Xanthomonas oryzae]OLG91992.1 hypothetical protein BXO471_12860 [Xanthomonas oryzae pv. oryzae]OLG99267.1 hypothetical protein BXO582_15290 [Xanthomonas oryzae pv. oryzae]OLH35754.1 hypothetical protein DXO052_13775 [Xanthomonas oryzae pv. oryzae]
MRALLIAVLLTSLLPVTAAPTHTQTPPASPSAPPQPMAEVITRYPVATATLAGREIRLGEHEGTCTVVHDGDVLVLGIGAACCLSTDRRHAAHVHRFHGSEIVLVQHAQPTSRPDWDVAAYGPICAFEAQAVREVGGVLEPGSVASSWHCDPTAGADQKQFVYSYDSWPNRWLSAPMIVCNWSRWPDRKVCRRPCRAAHR